MKAKINKSGKWLLRCLLLATISLLLSNNKLFAQTKIGDNPSSINAASVLELESTNKGFLMTRITDTSLINLLSPPLGMLILFNNNLYIKGATGWVQIQTIDQSALSYLKSSSLTSGSVLFRGANNISEDNTNFKYDSTNKTLSIGGWLSSTVPNAQVAYTAFSPSQNYPRGHMNIGNSTADLNVDFVVAPMYSSAGVQKQAGFQVSTNRLESDPGDKDLILSVSPTQSLILSTTNNSQSYAAGNPIYFQVELPFSNAMGTGLVINNDSSNTVTVGSNSANATAQFNVLHRRTYAAAWFDNKIRIGSNSGTTGQLLLHGGTSGTLTIQPSADAGTWSLTLPSSTGNNGQVLQTDGSGVSSWTNVISPVDTANMLSAYKRFAVTSVATGYGVSGGTITGVGTILVDSSIIASRVRVQKAVDSIDVVKINVSDTANMLSAYKRFAVTSVATGYGVNGGTITSVGTILVDSSAIASRERVQKAVDSINVVKINVSDTAGMLSSYARTASLPSIAGKVNFTDTASMLTAYKNNISSLITDTATLISRFNAKVNITDTANMLSGYTRISPIVSSSVSGATVTYTAFNPLINYPRGHMDIGNSAADINVNFVVAPMYSSAGVQKQSGFQVSTNKLASDNGDRDLILSVSPTKSLILSTANNSQTYTAGNPLYFQVELPSSNLMGTGLLINNDANNTVTMGSESANTTAQLNVLHRNTLAAAWFDNKISIGANAGNNGQILLNGSTSGTVTVQPAAAAGTWNLTLPAATGTSGQVLQTDGTGVTSWVSVAPSNSAITSTSSASYAVLTSDKYVIYTGSSTATLTLPTAVSVAGKEYIIKNMSSSTVTINTTSSQLIWEDANTQNASTSLGSTAQNNWIKLVSDGTRWIGFRSSF